MFFNFKKKKTIVYSPLSGKRVALSSVSDQVFSQGLMGPGFAIEPTVNEIYAPFEGTVTSVFPTKHAISIKSKNGQEVLLHIGIDTVQLNGEGFEIFVSENDKVTKDTLVAKVDFDYIRNQGKPDTLMVLFPEEASIPTLEDKTVVAKEEFFTFE